MLKMTPSNNRPKYLLVVGGATATGKTAMAIRLAKVFNTEILSADSRQFYREMTIGTAKPAPEDLAAAPHHFINFLSVTEPYSVGDFERDALQILEQIFKEKDIAILVGGSGLFLRAVYAGLDEFPLISPETKAWVANGASKGGLSWLQQRVAELDPVYFERVDRQNPARLRRALEVCRESGRPFSGFLDKRQPARPFQPVFLLLERPRQELYAQIDARVDKMLADGLEEEARALLPFRHYPALRTVGYEEWFDCFDGLICRETAVEKIKQHSRNYAKRQATWFNKHGVWKRFHPDDVAGILAYCMEKTNEPG